MRHHRWLYPQRIAIVAPAVVVPAVAAPGGTALAAQTAAHHGRGRGGRGATTGEEAPDVQGDPGAAQIPVHRGHGDGCAAPTLCLCDRWRAESLSCGAPCVCSDAELGRERGAARRAGRGGVPHLLRLERAAQHDAGVFRAVRGRAAARSLITPQSLCAAPNGLAWRLRGRWAGLWGARSRRRVGHARRLGWCRDDREPPEA